MLCVVWYVHDLWLSFCCGTNYFSLRDAINNLMLCCWCRGQIISAATVSVQASGANLTTWLLSVFLIFFLQRASVQMIRHFVSMGWAIKVTSKVHSKKNHILTSLSCCCWNGVINAIRCILQWGIVGGNQLRVWQGLEIAIWIHQTNWSLPIFWWTSCIHTMNIFENLIGVWTLIRNSTRTCCESNYRWMV
jgi:hypothetical protein